MIHEMPSIFLHSTFSQFSKIPKNWNDTLLPSTISELSKNIGAFFDPFNTSPFSDCTNSDTQYYKDFLLNVKTELGGLYDLINLFPIFSHIIGGDNSVEFFYFLDLNTTKLLFQYCWLLVIDCFISITENRSAIAFIVANSADNDELEEIDVIDTDTNSAFPVYFKKDVANLISLYIDNFKNMVDITNQSYSNIRDKVDIMRQKEKKNLATNFLGKMNREELSIENELKKLKLGNWSENVHFFRYNKAYEAEASKLLDRYIDYNDEIYQTSPLANVTDDRISGDGADDEDNVIVDESLYAYGIDGDGYEDDEYDDDEYDNDDYANNDNFDS